MCLIKDSRPWSLQIDRFAYPQKQFTFTPLSSYFLCLLLCLRILPPPHPKPALISQLIRQSAVVRYLIIKELKPYLENADVMAKLNYLNKARPLIMHVLQSFIS